MEAAKRMNVAGFVLTGGNSTRMGRDKALLRVGSETMCERIGDVLSDVAEQVTLVGHPERYGQLKFPCVADLRPGFGPLSGIETALSLQMADLNLVTGCDALNISADWLRALLETAERSGALCVVAQDKTGNLEPLCAVYRRECGTIVSRAITEKRLRALDLLEELGAVPVPISGMLANLNTPTEYDELINARRI
jgi:molybdopterin-guanine dinucleotide biosynthesis protein A